MPWIVVLSGAVGSGKSTIARAIAKAVSAHRISTRELIIEQKLVPSERLSLQRAGDELDVETDFRWVAEGVEKQISGHLDKAVVIVDAVRRSEQIDELRKRFPNVRHVHAVASHDELRFRHTKRQSGGGEPAEYTEVQLNSTEQGVATLAEGADILIDAGRLDERGVAAAVLAGTGLYPAGPRRRLVDVLVGGQFGSEGKGNICSFIAAEYDVLVRVGGPNAGHIVYDPFFKFAQLPSGTLHNPNSRLIIGPATTLSLKVLFEEMSRLSLEHRMEITSERLSIDPQAIIIEQGDIDWEEGALESIGSTKQGVGSATARKILGRGGEGTFGAPVRLARDVPELAPFIRPTFSELEKAFAGNDRVLLEGTQGTDISLHHGMWPHVTSRDTSAAGCLADAGIAPDRVNKVIMVTRTYPIRVGGHSGYMGVEIGAGEISARSGLPEADVRRTEMGTISGKPRRIGEFDLGQVRRSAALNGANAIALTFADYLDGANREARSFADLDERAQRRVREIEEATGARVELIAVGPGRANIIDRRVD